MPRGRPRKNAIVSQPQAEAAQQVTNEGVVVETVEAKPAEQKQAAGRPKRVPINGYRDILKVAGQEPGWHYAWIADENTYKMEQGGYDFVTHDVTVGDRRINAASQVGSKISIPGGNGITLFLMRCPNEVYQEEMDLLHEKIDENEQALLNKEAGRYGDVKVGRGKPSQY
jgi:hypothetical protein